MTSMVIDERVGQQKGCSVYSFVLSYLYLLQKCKAKVRPTFALAPDSTIHTLSYTATGLKNKCGFIFASVYL